MSNSDHTPLTPAQVERLTADPEPWLSCDDCFDQIDGYVDNLIGGVPGLDEPLRVHLLNCPACREEAESLISVIAESDDISADTPLRAFRAELDRGDSTPVGGRRWIGHFRRRR